MAQLTKDGLNITYVERPGSPRESFSPSGGARVQRVFDVNWNKRWGFLAAVLGFSEVRQKRDLLENGYPYVHRVVPDCYAGYELYTYLVNNRWLWASTVESVEGISPGNTDLANPNLVNPPPPGTAAVSPVGVSGRVMTDDGYPQYALARITIGYEALTYRVMEDALIVFPNQAAERNSQDFAVVSGGIDPAPTVTLSAGPGGALFPTPDPMPDESSMLRYVSRHVQPTAEHLGLPFGQLLFYDDNGNKLDPAANGIGKIIPAMEVQYTWHQVPAVPNHIRKYLGCVNVNPLPDHTLGSRDDGVMNTLGQNFAPGTLLLVAIEVKPYRQIIGNVAYDIVYRMKHFSAIKLPPDNPNDQTPHFWPQEKGHNYFIHYQTAAPNAGVYTYHLVADAKKNPVFPSADFSNLFRLYEYNKLLNPPIQLT